MFSRFLGVLRLCMQVLAQTQPPRILQVHREALKPGSETAYRELEEDTARICAQLGCPHPYLAIEALTGLREVWFFNGYNSPAEQKQVVEDYAKNAPLMAALTKNSRRKASLTRKPVEVFANYRRDLSRGAPWSMAAGRFLVISVTKGALPLDGTVFEAPDGTKFVLVAAQTREGADAKATRPGSESRVFAVRPYWSMPAAEWIAADPEFWQPDQPVKPE